MKYAPFGISNIAWPNDALDEALPLIAGLGCTCVEIAPFNVFGNWDHALAQAPRLRDEIERHGLTCSALQGILFQAPDVELFASEASRGRLHRHLDRVAALAGLLGAPACVFGAPKQRDPGDLPPAQAWNIAVAALRRAGPAFAAAGSAIAFEANARRYGCRFVTTTAAAARLVADVATPGIGLQIDTGTLLLEAEPPQVLTTAAPWAVHAHVSEADLQPPGAADHGPIAAALRDSHYTGSLSIEMRCVDDWRGAVAAAVRFVTKAYA